ncbi:EAL domain-containing protein [Duganella sp. FT3S]|uniref:EAL domain-containing protein n=1 Tax=Rugamonas fusca TaxID=2758568 RepID=A0A7W2EIZ9_9BURK|nr:EAL domain-containing protein [Rugamonas fusca]MBA5606610.1 EAL domain-containing protein [Rugamonas fusca]
MTESETRAPSAPEDEVLKQLKLADTYFKHSVASLVILDRHFNFVRVNQTYADACRRDINDFAGRNHFELFPSDARLIFEDVLRSKQGYVTFTRAFEFADQPERGVTYWDWTLVPVLDGAGEVEYLVFSLVEVTERKRAELLIWHQANIDSLTGAPNRYLFKERLQQRLDQAPSAPFALLLLDLDHFKEVNDTLGHDRGDELLVEAVRRIDACLGGPGQAARLGGDEFAVIIADGAQLASLDALAGRLVASVAAPYQLGGERAYVSASIGIAQYPHDGDTMADLLRHADQAMYAAKGAGRNRFSRFSLALLDAMQQRIGLSNDLRDALREGQLAVHYQPIVELATGRVRKAEALLRWQHPGRGAVPPSHFVPLAEANGMIVEIGDWVLRCAADQVRRVMALGCSAFQIAVNVSPLQFRNDVGLCKRWLAYLAALGLPTCSVGIEITEGLLLDVSAELTETLRRFSAAGMQISLDDFGTGYSSLAYLTRFELDVLKIDRSFVHRIDSHAPDLALCEAIVAMAHKLGMTVVAEGVETARQRELLVAAGCDYGQGYLFAPPMTGPELEAGLRRASH